MGFMDFLADRTYKHGNEVDRDYQKRCDKKIKELCGGFTPNDNFKKRVKKFKVDDDQSNTYEKHILRFECKYGLLKYENIENRLDELLQMDVETLSGLRASQNTSKFKTQKDIEDFMGEGYESKFKGTLKSEYRNYFKKQVHGHESSKMERKDDFKINKQKAHLASQDKNKTNVSSKVMVTRFHRIQQEREEELKKEKQEREKQAEKFRQEEARKRRMNSESSKRKLNQNDAPKKESIPKEKLNLIKRGSADVEVFTNVKSNTALASTALFLATGVFVGEAKEEMKWIKTKLEIKDDRIIIKKPYSYHKYKDFYKFNVFEDDDGFYVICITLKDKRLIVRTNEEYLGELIVDKINNQNLSYERVI